MEQFKKVWESVKTYAVKPILGIPAVVVIAIAAAGAYLVLGKKKGTKRRLF
jgi:hypothetical protein